MKNHFEDVIEITSVPSPTGEFENKIKVVEAQDGTLFVQVMTTKNGKPIARPTTFNLLDLLTIRDSVVEGCKAILLDQAEQANLEAK